MLVFIDESGIHKQTDHSVFALAYVAILKKSVVEARILELEQRLHVSRFAWAHVPWKLRIAFINGIVDLPFTAKIAIFRNPIKSDEALEWAAQHLLVEKNVRTLYIDGKKPRWIEHRLKKVLRDKGVSVRKLKTVRDQSLPGIRLADAIAGVARAYSDDHQGRAAKLWRVIRHKITAHLVGGQVDE